MEQYGKLYIPVRDFCKELFGMEYKRACEIIREGKWPFATVSMLDSKKAPYLAHVSDLANYLDGRMSDAREDFGKFNG